MNEIELFFKSLTTTISIAKGLYSLGKSTEINQKIVPLLETILSMEGNINSMKSFIRKLEEENELYRKKLMEFENWKETDSQYELKKVFPTITVRIRKGLENKEIQDSIWYCANCWNDKIQSPLQFQYKSLSEISGFCPRCKTPHEYRPPIKPQKPIDPKAWT